MNASRVRMGMMLTFALTAAFAGPAAAQVDVTGSWAMEVTTQAGGTTKPSMTLKQDGTKITGHYSSDTLGEADVTGTVDGPNITITFQAEMQGTEIPVVYKATLDDKGAMSGTIDVASGMATGTFTATRAKSQ
jgi:hypothetical protein